MIYRATALFNTISLSNKCSFAERLIFPFSYIATHIASTRTAMGLLNRILAVLNDTGIEYIYIYIYELCVLAPSSGCGVGGSW